MGQALYRKYRSKSLDEIIGQEHITKTLSTAIASGRISHAYLFTGPRGTGKTSVARILAHEINKLPYTDDSMHIDIIEIDAASNRRIDEIRELRDKVFIAPTSAPYKVYIIDEVHMLTREAFNALLKTLEEPPAHVIFILATTDAHKLPDTIVSRTQRFTFKPIEKDKVVAHLKHLAQAEKISVSDEALGLLAEHGGGSFRDSISLLDQASNQEQKLELSDVQSMLGIPPAEAVDSLLEAIVTNQPVSTLINQISELLDQGFQPASIAKQLAETLRDQLVAAKTHLSASDTLALLSELLEVPTAHDPERYLEIVLLQHLKPETTQAIQKPEPKKQTLKADVAPEPMPETMSKEITHTDEALELPTQEPVIPKKHSEAKQDKSLKQTESKTFDAQVWPEVLLALKQKYNTLYGVVRMAEPTFNADGSLKLAFSFAFHQKRVSETKNRQALADIIQQVTGHNVQIECVFNKDAVSPKVPSLPPPNASEVVSQVGTADISTISNIFGGGELLES